MPLGPSLTQLQTLAAKFAVMHNAAFSDDVVGCDPRTRGAHEAARVHHAARRRGGRGRSRRARSSRAHAARSACSQPLAANDPEAQARFAAFHAGLAAIGLDRRPQCADRVPLGRRQCRTTFANTRRNWSRSRRTSSSPQAAANVGPLLQATRTVPIVFANVADPVGGGFVESLARPGGNATGFIHFEYGLSGKWLELLKEIAPRVTRVAVLRDAGQSAGIGQFGAIQAVAPSLGLEASPVNVRDAGEIERAITAFARSPNGGLIVTGSALAVVHRDLIITLAAQHKLPAIYSQRSFVTGGGLISYGPDFIDQYRRAAAYVDRILKGEKPADLPVQAPTKYELVINLKTAKALGLDVPPVAARPRRRGDRVGCSLLHCMSP